MYIHVTLALLRQKNVQNIEVERPRSIAKPVLVTTCVNIHDAVHQSEYLIKRLSI